MNEKICGIKKFLEVCEKLRFCVYQDVAENIGEFLKTIACTQPLVYLFKKSVSSFNLNDYIAEREFSDAEGKKRLKILDADDFSAILFCIFSKIHKGEIKGDDFFLSYFNTQDDIQCSYNFFCAQIVSPFIENITPFLTKIIRSIYGEEYKKDLELFKKLITTEIGRYGDLDDIEVVGAKLILNKILSYCEGGDRDLIKALLVGYKYTIDTLAGLDEHTLEIYKVFDRMEEDANGLD